MDIETVTIITNAVITIINALIAAFGKKKTVTTSLSEIEAREEAKKQKRIAKACKKNHITNPSESSKEVVADYIKIEEEVVL